MRRRERRKVVEEIELWGRGDTSIAERGLDTDRP